MRRLHSMPMRVDLVFSHHGCDLKCAADGGSHIAHQRASTNVIFYRSEIGLAVRRRQLISRSSSCRHRADSVVSSRYHRAIHNLSIRRPSAGRIIMGASSRWRPRQCWQKALCRHARFAISWRCWAACQLHGNSICRVATKHQRYHSAICR